MIGAKWAAAVVIGAIALGCGSADSPAPGPGAEQGALSTISPADLSAALAHKDFLLVNVHIPRAGQIAATDAHVPYTDVDALARRIGEAKDTKVILYCLGEGMSRPAAQALIDRGYTAVRILSGGMSGWTKAGYSLEP